MRKWLFFGFLIALLGVTGCQKPAAAQPASRKILKQSENIWHDSGSWTDGKYSPQANSVAPIMVLTRHGTQVGASTLTYAQAQTAITQSSAKKKIHWFSLKQINAGLAKAKAGIRLKTLADLTFFSSPVSPTPNVGFVAHGHRLFAITIIGQSADKKKLPPMTVYTNTGKTPHSVATSSLAGRWLGADGSQLRVIGNKLYQNNTLGASRFLIQPLRNVKASTLYTATYSQHLALAAQHGYQLAKKTTTVATDGATLYVFLTKTRMVSITQSGTVTYTKTNKGRDTSKIKPTVMQVFKAADARKNLLPAISVADIGSSNYEVACHAFSMLTDPYSSKDIDWQKATLVNGKVTIANMYPELK